VLYKWAEGFFFVSAGRGVMRSGRGGVSGKKERGELICFRRDVHWLEKETDGRAERGGRFNREEISRGAKRGEMREGCGRAPAYLQKKWEESKIITK
jgi:hypothetical protein